MLAERVQYFIGECWGQGGFGQVVEGFLEAEAVEEPDPVDEGFVFRGKVGSVCRLSWYLRGCAVSGEDIFNEIVEDGAFVMVWGGAVYDIVVEGTEIEVGCRRVDFLG